jgi:oligopeptide transport system substrate-binding protein
MADWSADAGKTTMRWAAGASVPTLDVSRSTDTTSSTVIYQMFDAPYKFNAAGSIEPLAAESFEVSDDGTVFTVHLRSDGVWSDGEPVLAQHYVDGVLRLLSPDMANDYAYVMFDIVGAADYNSGDVATLDAITAIDDYTFQFTLSEPRSYFDSILAFSTFHPVRLDVIEEFGDEWTRAGNMVSNGAYVLVEHNPGDNLVMEKNEQYWDAANVQFDRLEVSMIGEPATSLAAFENGELDWTAQGGFPPEDIPRLVDTPEFLRTPRPGTYYMGLNTTAQHTNNKTFREALSYAVDKRTILDNVAETPWRTEAYGVIPPEIVGYQGDAVGFGFDVAAAQAKLAEYMAEAGIEDAGDIVVELWYNKGAGNQEILEAVEAMWEENLGIDVRTVNVEWATYLETLEECNVIGGGGF